MRGGDRCSMSLPVFLLIPQDNSVSAPTPSLLSHASICPLVSTLAQILVTFTLLLLLPAFLFVFLLSHFVALFLPPLSQSLFLSVWLFLFLVPPLLLYLSLKTVVFTLCLVLLQWRMETCLTVVVTGSLPWE